MKTGKRLLFVTKNEFMRELDGGSQRTAAIVRALTAHGYEVTVITVKPARLVGSGATVGRVTLRDAAAILRVLAVAVATGSLSALKWFSPNAVRLIASTARHGAYDGLIVEYSQLVPYRRLFSGPAVLSMHNVEAELLSNYAASASSAGHRWVAAHEARRMAKVERTVGEQFDRVITVSERDRQSVDPDGGFAVAASNGVRDECFEHESARHSEVVFVAHLGWRPNIDAARWLVNEVWPHVRREAPHLTLRLVGRQPSPEVLALRREDVLVTGDVAATVPYVGEAVVATAPLLAAGGTRLKILEALAVGTPVVATSLGALGLEELAGPSLRIVDAPEAFAQQIVAASMTPVDRATTRELAEGYRWPRALQPLLDAVADVVA